MRYFTWKVELVSNILIAIVDMVMNIKNKKKKKQTNKKNRIKEVTNKKSLASQKP